jgi:hypothetical protein
VGVKRPRHKRILAQHIEESVFRVTERVARVPEPHKAILQVATVQSRVPAHDVSHFGLGETIESRIDSKLGPFWGRFIEVPTIGW